MPKFPDEGLMRKVTSRLAKLALDISALDGSRWRALTLQSLRELSEEMGLPLKDLERQALMEGMLPLRYIRNVGTLGLEGQLRLLNSKVAVFGLGGLGGLVVELLARLGVGKLVMVDGDIFSEDNLNRQILSAPQYIGMGKVEVAAQRVIAINPATELYPFQIMAKEDDMKGLIEDCDVVVDALDNIPSRFDLQRACASRKLPLVHGAIAGFIGQVMTIFPGDLGIEMIYQGASERGIEIATGNPATTPAMVASLQVQEVVKIITGIGEPLRHRLLFIDTENNIYEIIDMR